MEGILPGAGGWLLVILMMALSGFVIGVLARWIMPGPDPMGVGKTILLGIAGSILGGLVASLLRLAPDVHPLWVLLLEIGGALLLLWLFKRYRSGSRVS